MVHIGVQVNYTLLLEKLKERNISSYQLSKDYKIPHKTIYNVCHGKMITLETLAKLAYVLNCNIGELVQFEYTITKEE